MYMKMVELVGCNHQGVSNVGNSMPLSLSIRLMCWCIWRASLILLVLVDKQNFHFNGVLEAPDVFRYC